MAESKPGLAQTAVGAAIDDEMVPLAVAATVAYFHVTDAAQQVNSQSDLADVVPLVAIALSTVAPIHGEAGALRNAEVRDRLYGSRRPSLDGLSMRRGDLRTAIITLREARNAFGK